MAVKRFHGNVAWPEQAQLPRHLLAGLRLAITDALFYTAGVALAINMPEGGPA